MTHPQPGEKAPDFALPADNGDTVSLSQFAGQKLVLFFYPKASTDACTREAVDFSRLKPDLEKHGAAVVGLSADSVKRQQNFSKKNGLTTALLADESTKTLEAFGVWQEKAMYGRKYMGIVRTTFLIGEDGTILQIWDGVKVPGHAEEVLSAVKAAKAASGASGK